MLYTEALKVFSVIEIPTDSKLTVAILNLLVNGESGGMEKLSEQFAQWRMEHSRETLFGHQSLAISSVDNIVVQDVWKFLNGDQQFLLTSYLSSGKSVKNMEILLK